jgi:hypothetical protein
VVMGPPFGALGPNVLGSSVVLVLLAQHTIQ